MPERIGFAPCSVRSRSGTRRELPDTDFQGTWEMQSKKQRASWREARRLKSEEELADIGSEYSVMYSHTMTSTRTIRRGSVRRFQLSCSSWKGRSDAKDEDGHPTSGSTGLPTNPAPGEPYRSVALRAPERQVARSASPDLSDRALIRAAEQNRSSRSADIKIMRNQKKTIPFREGNPENCIVCNNTLHKKSEYYCSEKCEAIYRDTHDGEIPPFLSKWKIRKYKTIKDPLIEVRKRARRITQDLLREGKIDKTPCVVCGNEDVIAHHEDYSRPDDVIWICETHHKAYHDGEIGLFKNKLWWNPKRLIPRRMRKQNIPKKYQEQIEQFKKKKRQKAEQANPADAG